MQYYDYSAGCPVDIRLARTEAEWRSGSCLQRNNPQLLLIPTL